MPAVFLAGNGMITLLILIALAVLGWSYAAGRGLSRLSTVFDRLLRLSITSVIVSAAAAMAFAVLARMLHGYASGLFGVRVHDLAHDMPALAALLAAGWCMLFVFAARKAVLVRMRRAAVAGRVTAVRVETHDVSHLFVPGYSLFQTVCRVAAVLPGNMVCRSRTREFSLRIPGLPRPLDGLRIVHLSDFHFERRLTPEYYRRLVTEANSLRPDIVAMTGDFYQSASCIPDIAAILAGLRATHGVYFVCGNHDIWHRPAELVKALHKNGFVHLGGAIVRIAIGDACVEMAGTERPWRHDNLRSTLGPKPAGAFRLALTHHPDNALWLKDHDADLVLAGHTHGGQNALPLLGPLVVPSCRGLGHAAGFVPYGDTLLYVTYGASPAAAVLMPFRLLCPAEVVCLELTCAAPSPEARQQ
ncbi:hypothetical protein GX586_08870 [bacterium]|nr:hypothetical protein [bacterium]